MLFVLLLLSSCSSEPAVQSETVGGVSDENDVEVIIRNAPPPTRVATVSNADAYATIPYTFSYIDSSGIVKEIIPSDSVFHLAIGDERKVVEVAVEYQPSAFLKYYLFPGDKAVFTFRQGVPQLTLTNPGPRPIIPNLDLELIEKIQNGNLRSRDMLRRPIDYMPYDFIGGNPVDHDRHLRQFVSDLNKASLVEARAELEQLEHLLKSNKLTQTEFELRQLQLLDLLDSIPTQRQQTFMYTHAYQNKVMGFALKLWYNNTEKEGAEKAIDLIDSIGEDSTIDTESKKYLKRAIVEIAVSSQTLAEYVDPVELLEGSNDVAYIAHLSEHQQRPDILNNPDLLVLNSKNDTFSLNEYIFDQRGKFVYVDLWASWCAPCREAMPDSEALRNFFKGQKVAFIYLAIRDDRSKWSTASAKEGISFESGNLFALNAETASYLKDLEVHSIPRYLLYGPDGVLLYRNALPPSSIEPLLSELLDRSATDRMPNESM